MPTIQPSSSLLNSSVADAALRQRALKAEQEAASLKRQLEFEKQRKVDCERAAYHLARNFQIQVYIYFYFYTFTLHIVLLSKIKCLKNIVFNTYRKKKCSFYMKGSCISVKRKQWPRITMPINKELQSLHQQLLCISVIVENDKGNLGYSYHERSQPLFSS